MEAIIAAVLFALLGFGWRAISKNDTVLSYLREGHPNNDLVRLFAKFGAVFAFVLSGLCAISAILSLLQLL
jgi:hypothetical protein